MQIDAFLKKTPKLHVNERICASISEFEFFFAANTHPFQMVVND